MSPESSPALSVSVALRSAIVAVYSFDFGAAAATGEGGATGPVATEGGEPGRGWCDRAIATLFAFIRAAQGHRQLLATDRRSAPLQSSLPSLQQLLHGMCGDGGGGGGGSGGCMLLTANFGGDGGGGAEVHRVGLGHVLALGGRIGQCERQDLLPVRAVHLMAAHIQAARHCKTSVDRPVTCRAALSCCLPLCFAAAKAGSHGHTAPAPYLLPSAAILQPKERRGGSVPTRCASLLLRPLVCFGMGAWGWGEVGGGTRSFC